MTAGDRHVAFIRAINVAGHAVVKMDRVRDAFAAAGCRNVRSYIQSGNVLFDAPGATATLFKMVRAKIGALIGAAEKVCAGDLTARVEAPTKGDELGKLSRAFNRMTSQLESQQRELIEANRQLDLRRRFTETVLAGVSAGVLEHQWQIHVL